MTRAPCHAYIPAHATDAALSRPEAVEWLLFWQLGCCCTIGQHAIPVRCRAPRTPRHVARAPWNGKDAPGDPTERQECGSSLTQLGRLQELGVQQRHRPLKPGAEPMRPFFTPACPAHLVVSSPRWWKKGGANQLCTPRASRQTHRLDVSRVAGIFTNRPAVVPVSSIPSTRATEKSSQNKNLSSDMSALATANQLEPIICFYHDWSRKFTVQRSS